MRVSIPGQKRRNRKSDSQSIIEEDKKQPTVPQHNPDYDMQYGCSRKTGYKCGGHFWNPPAYCDKRILTYGYERWVNVGMCKECHRYKSRTCPAAMLPKIEYVDGKPVYDEPSNRKPKRIERAHVSRRRS